MKYLSVCSGIEAATCAWHGLGWTPFAFSEIEPFPSAVLAHHYPNTPNMGDMTKFKEWPDADVNVLVGGTPCQSFSVAGLRKGLADPRGNLMLTYLAIADRYRPGWVVWENVPGVLSSNGGRDFGTFLGALGELGYGWAYRTLDAQYFGVAQRRRRVFVVGCLGDWRRAAAVLFERESLLGNPVPSREKGKVAAPTIAGSSNGGGANGPGRNVDSCESLVCMSSGQANAEIAVERSPTLNCLHEAPIVARSLRDEGFDASEDGTGRGTPLTVAYAIQAGALRENPACGPDGVGIQADHSYTLEARSEVQAVAFAQNTRDEVREMPYVGALAAEPGMKQTSYIRQSMQVRRLTPRECSRLQGFPDSYLELYYANADEAHSAQILHELWREAGAQASGEQGWRTGVTASLLSPEILLSGVYVGWISWSMAARCADARRAVSSQTGFTDGFVRCLRVAGADGRSPYRRESFEQCALELGANVSVVPYEEPQARAILRGSELWPEAQRTWPLRYALAKASQVDKGTMNPDGPRYKALGNSMAVPVMRWIGERIQMVETI